MSLLVRRHDINRNDFSRHWGTSHADLVAKLPFIRAYAQNHVVAEYPVTGCCTYQADGIVELYFDSEDCMHRAFAHPLARAVRADEAAFLGHGTGYAIKETGYPSEHSTHKIILMADAPGLALLDFRLLSNFPWDWQHCSSDIVSAVITRTEMIEPPQLVSGFHQWCFADGAAAARAGAILASAIEDEGMGDGPRIGIYLVKEHVVLCAQEGSG